MDEKRNSLAMIPLLVAFFVAGSLGTYAAAALPDLQMIFAISAAQGSMLYIAWGGGIVLGSLLATRMITRSRPSQILALASLIGALAANLGATTLSYPLFLLCYAMLGVTSGAILTTGHGFVGRRSNHQSASNISALDFSLSLGTISAPLLIVYFVSGNHPSIGRENVFSLYASLLLIFAVVTHFSHMGDPLPRQTAPVSSKRIDWGILKNPVFIWFSLVSFLHHAFEYGHTYWFVSYGAQLPDIGLENARSILVGFLSGLVVSRLVLSWVAIKCAMHHILPLAVALALAIVLFMPDYTTYVSLSLANIAFGAAVGVVFPAMMSVAVSTSDRHGAVFSSSGLIAGSLGAQLSALLLGFIIQQEAAQQIYTALALIGGLLLIAVHVLIRHCTPTLRSPQSHYMEETQ